LDLNYFIVYLKLFILVSALPVVYYVGMISLFVVQNVPKKLNACFYFVAITLVNECSLILTSFCRYTNCCDSWKQSYTCHLTFIL